MISVIMPVYNGEAHLKEAIDSILNQTFQDFEFLIINDGSIDRSEEIILSFEDSRIRYISNETNLGIVKTLNKGLNMVSRKYIARMDADDISVPHRFEKQVAFMEANPDLAACGSNVMKFYDDIHSNINPTYIKLENKDLKIQSLFFSAFWHPTMIMRSQMLKDNNLYYKEGFKHVEDKLLWIDISFIGAMANIEEPLLYYRVHPDQVSTKFFKEQHERSMALTRDALQKLGLDMDKFTDKIVAYISYPTRCYDVADLYEVDKFGEEVVNVLSVHPKYDAEAVTRFLKEQIIKTLAKSQNIGIPLFSYILKSKFVDLRDFDFIYFIKVILKRNTKKIIKQTSE